VRSVLAGLLSALVCPAQTITVDQLTHRVPPSAAREYRASLKALDTGDLGQSIAHCRKAMDSDPDNPAAHNDLGILYLSDGQMERALIEFDREIALAPKSAAAHVNASYTLLALGRTRDAEAAAREAVGIEPANRRAHLLLGWSIVAQFRYTKEALESLRRAGHDFPEAHLAAADVLVHQGSLAEARASVEAYLDSGSTEQKTVAEAWLRFLTIE